MKWVNVMSIVDLIRTYFFDTRCLISDQVICALCTRNEEASDDPVEVCMREFSSQIAASLFFCTSLLFWDSQILFPFLFNLRFLFLFALLFSASLVCVCEGK